MRAEYDDMTNDELFALYAQNRSEELKWEIAMRYIGLVKTIALQIRGVYCSFTQLDDVINEGVIVLADAVEKYDPARSKFDTYVTKRIRGMIIDLARHQDWVPRAVRRRAREIEQINGELYQKLGRFPTDKESADAMGITEQEYLDTLASSTLHTVLSLEETFEGMEPVVEQPDGSPGVETPEQVLQSQEMLEMLTEAVSTLKENEQMVLSLYYQKGLKMKEIASVMNVSAPRVSQVHAKAIQKLQILMNRYMNDMKMGQISKGRGKAKKTLERERAERLAAEALAQAQAQGAQEPEQKAATAADAEPAGTPKTSKTGKTTKASKAAKTPKTSKAPKAPKAPKTPRVSKTAKAAKAK